MCNDHDYCYVELPNEDNKILKYNNKLYTKKKIHAHISDYSLFNNVHLIQQKICSKMR